MDDALLRVCGYQRGTYVESRELAVCMAELVGLTLGPAIHTTVDASASTFLIQSYLEADCKRDRASAQSVVIARRTGEMNLGSDEVVEGVVDAPIALCPWVEGGLSLPSP
ncbi:MAG: hypothetical protein H6736_12460 [Alphaproteobacteria bacterium]|nr:hypothetical protein [Alphaproteobacteria bacterium]